MFIKEVRKQIYNFFSHTCSVYLCWQYNKQHNKKKQLLYALMYMHQQWDYNNTIITRIIYVRLQVCYKNIQIFKRIFKVFLFS